MRKEDQSSSLSVVHNDSKYSLSFNNLKQFPNPINFASPPITL
jgi:hypothetical protein